MGQQCHQGWHSQTVLKHMPRCETSHTVVISFLDSCSRSWLTSCTHSSSFVRSQEVVLDICLLLPLVSDYISNSCCLEREFWITRYVYSDSYLFISHPILTLFETQTVQTEKILLNQETSKRPLFYFLTSKGIWANNYLSH